MNQPFLLIVTGRPASGKSTLAHLLSKQINCPLLSRDELKEGYINTVNITHAEADDSVAQHIYDTFFEAIELFITKGISIIAEAAFQDKLWKSKLLNLSGKAAIKIIICTTNLDILNSRFINRLLNNPNREKYHGDKEMNLINGDYTPVNMDVPTLEVDTTENYDPNLQEIISFIKERKNS